MGPCCGFKTPGKKTGSICSSESAGWAPGQGADCNLRKGAGKGEGSRVLFPPSTTPGTSVCRLSREGANRQSSEEP